MLNHQLKQSPWQPKQSHYNTSLVVFLFILTAPLRIRMRVDCFANKSTLKSIEPAIQRTQKKQPPKLWETIPTQTSPLIKKPGINMPGRSSSTGVASKSPPHRAWVKTVIVRQAVLLALDHRSLTPSQDFHPSGIS
jgi:hypothetical protein